jgi:pentose-5-phosphate-3-epimerase
MFAIIPSILTNNPGQAKELLLRCGGVVDRVSIDIIDGFFAKNKTVDPIIFSDLEMELSLDFQLMVKEPVNWIEKCVRGGADRIIGHIEKMASQTEFVEKVQISGRVLVWPWILIPAFPPLRKIYLKVWILCY